MELISIPDFIAAEPFGRMKTYELIKAGVLETVTEGRRRLIVADSYRRYVERLRAEAKAPRPSPNPKAASHSPGGWPPGHVSPPRRQPKQEPVPKGRRGGRQAARRGSGRGRITRP